MSRNLYYQSCMRISQTNRIILSSEETSSITTKKKFYESDNEIFLYELHNFTLRKVIIEKSPNALAEISKFLDTLYETRQPQQLISLDQQSTCEENHNELSLNQLLEKRDRPIYYTLNEEKKLLNLDENNFKIWFRNEISSILKVIEQYKSDDIEYDFPTNNCYVVNCAVITDNEEKKGLQNEVYAFYKRAVSIYSVITTDVIKSENGRKGLFKEVNFLKILLEIIIFQMDKQYINVEQYVDSLVKTYPKASFGASTSTGLCSILSKSDSKFKDLGNMIAKTLANLAPSTN